MATTTNFGWETPDDTDLVKDGAAAMRTLGNAIDTSFVDLKGGTTGQILSKASNTDLDYSWVSPNPGDITAVTATSPLTGGGTSGDVTVGIQDGTTSQKGAVQLEDSTSSTSTTKAATPNSVKSAYDLANGKGENLISTTILSGASTTISSIPQTYKTLKIIIQGVTNATADGKITVKLNNATNAAFLSGTETTAGVIGVTGGNITTNNNTMRTNTDNVMVIEIDRYSSAAVEGDKGMKVYGFYVKSGSGDIAYNLAGMAYGMGAGVSSVVISNSGGNLSTGTCWIYGVN